MGLIRKEMLIIRDWNRKSNSSAADESFGEVAGKPWTFWKVLRKHPLEGPPEGRFIRSPVVIVRQSKQVYTSHQDSQHFIYFKASSIATVNITQLFRHCFKFLASLKHTKSTNILYCFR